MAQNDEEGAQSFGPRNTSHFQLILTVLCENIEKRKEGRGDEYGKHRHVLFINRRRREGYYTKYVCEGATKPLIERKNNYKGKGFELLDLSGRY